MCIVSAVAFRTQWHGKFGGGDSGFRSLAAPCSLKEGIPARLKGGRMCPRSKLRAFAPTAHHTAGAGTLAHRVEQLLGPGMGMGFWRLPKSGGGLDLGCGFPEDKHPPCRQDPCGRAAASLAVLQNLEIARSLSLSQNAVPVTKSGPAAQFGA